MERLLNAPDGASAEWAHLKGKVVGVEFWATWCAPCIASIPHLNELAEQYRDEDVVFISLTDEPLATVESFLKRKPIKGWVALDTDRGAGDAYGVTGIPRTFLIGRTGKILGETDPSELKAEHIGRAAAASRSGWDRPAGRRSRLPGRPGRAGRASPRVERASTGTECLGRFFSAARRSMSSKSLAPVRAT